MRVGKDALKTPTLKCHKGTGQGYVVLNGHRCYVGKFGKPETRERYDRLVIEWLSNGRRLPAPASDARIVELSAAFWRFSQTYYKGHDGRLTSSAREYKLVLRRLNKLYGSTRVADFGARQYKALRHDMIASGLCRSLINKRLSLLKRIFRWGASEGLVPLEVDGALRTVEGLRRGRSEARETAPIRPVPEGHITAVRPFLSRQINALVTLQLHSGARPGELLKLRPIDLDMSGRVWLYKPTAHKTAHFGHARVIMFGPRSQEALRPFMQNRAVNAYLFDPREAERERHDRAKGHRRDNQKPNLKKTDRVVGTCYTVNSYRRAIHRACDQADVPRWSPHRLRHSAATNLRREFGIELAQTVLGHRLGSGITEIYAEQNITKAIEIIGKVG